MLGVLYTAGSLKAAASELAKNKLHLVAAREVRWDNHGRLIIHFSMEMGMLIVS
jgi:hypothetical protein